MNLIDSLLSWHIKKAKACWKTPVLGLEVLKSHVNANFIIAKLITLTMGN